ncbi:MAG TPA: PilC/PilY family type IV pilus protein [Syntrophorhabdaceae bacterium]|nr:PilC/PilY family type IV pilus protein [Syntrophorhabdaceae bacterium]
MVKMKGYFIIVFIALIIIFNPSLTQAQAMGDYCQMPSSIGTPVDPNLLLLIDTSGSMGWCAYSSITSGTSCDNGTYNASIVYEGYFDPTKYYKPVNPSDGVTYCDPSTSSCLWVETTPSGVPCTRTCTSWVCKRSTFGYDYCDPMGTHGCSSTRYACCSSWALSGDCNVDSGNYLNYKYMRRIDIVRWALTGGKPESCNNSIRSCDPEVYPDVQLSCDSAGCTLKGADGVTLVKALWERITGTKGGLLFQLKDFSPKPIIGAMFFNSSGVQRTVYVGDFTASASYDGVNPYKNVITAINDESTGGATPTGPAMWDALNYLAQNDAKYGGPQPQSGVGAEWKNPMYRCFDKNNDGNCQGNEFELVPCAKNFVLLLSDGQWNRGGFPVSSYCKISDDQESESPDPVVPAYWMHKKGYTNQPTGISSYVESVYTIGLWLGGTGERSLKNVAMYGAFDRNNTWPGGTSGYPDGICGPVDDCCTISNCGRGSSCTNIPASQPDWDKNGDGVPDTFFKADSATELKERIATVVLDLLRRISTGSAVSILASSEGSGANLLQAVYFPKKTFGSTEIDWVGKMHNLWYFVDPYLQNSNIREDTTVDKILDLKNDYIVNFYFDSTSNETLVKRYQDTDGDGSQDSYVNTINIEEVKNLWEAGKVLFERNVSTSPRSIYTQLSGSLVNFSTSNAAALQSYLNVGSLTDTQDLINYVHGIDKSGYRNRTVTISSITGTWKLGDIINSTPRIQSFSPVNTYHQNPPNGYNDATYYEFVNQNSYKNRGVAYVGANDGMLHAFYLGNLKQNWSGKGQYERGKLEGSDLGKEIWAFIPKHALPYLKYFAAEDYCHLYYVDSSTFLVDASINGNDNDTKTVNSWRTILIGGMGFGGATRNYGSSCTDCIKTPVSDLGYSSYFAIDVTDPDNPVLLWEFSHSELGMSTSGPAIIRVGDYSKNGKWYVVFASGPTGPINTAYRQFLGKSDQQLRLFVLDLKTGNLERKIDTGITNAFGGSIINSTLDIDKGNTSSSGFYKDDVVYIGYTKCADSPCTSSSTWTKGGVIRLLTKESENVGNWVVNSVIDNIGPVTAAVAKLQDRNNGKLWLYFGTGRYFYKMGTNIDDPGSTSDSTTIRRVYGLKEPCYSSSNTLDTSCSSSVTESNLKNQTSSPSSTLDSIYSGWYINLDQPDSTNLQERVITDPLAIFSGVVFFTTFRPSADICAVGGNTYIWAVDYKTGGGATGLLGKGLLQVSTGEIKELQLSSAFSEKEGRRTSAITGMPPRGQGLSVVIGPRPMKKIIHIKER